MPGHRGHSKSRRPLYLLFGCGALSCVTPSSKDDVQVTEEVQGDTSSGGTVTTVVTRDDESNQTSSAATVTSSSALTSGNTTTSAALTDSEITTDSAGTSETSGTSASTSPTSSPTTTTHTDTSALETSSTEVSNTESDATTTPDSSDAGPPACPPEPALTGGQQYCSNVKDNAGGGYGYELWAEGDGTGCMTVFGQGAAFKANWTDVEDFLARVGLDFDETRTHQQIGNIWAEFAETQTGSEEGLTYVGMYGWTVDPLREFYILDDWGTTKPAGVASDGTPRDEIGTMVIDGETYDVWKKTRENKPSIKGDATFDQYFSIRRTRRQCGRISVSEHFTGWEDLGLSLGKLYEVKILVESQFNSGSVEFTSASVVAD